MTLLTTYAMRYIDRPYIWGGDGTVDKFFGFDCSGLVLKCLWDLKIYDGPDITAEGIRKWCKSSGWIQVKKNDLQDGDLIFYGKSSVSHVSIALGDGLMIEAGGGTSLCKDLQTSTGCVRIEKVDRRKDFLCAYRRK